MNILILGSGGREHALAWRLSQDKSSHKVFVWPGNDGMKGEKLNFISKTFSKSEFKNVTETNNIDLVVPGAEKFLYEGVSDWCAEFNLACFGPTLKASELEKSKIYSKKFMSKWGIPTARFDDLTESFNRDVNQACLKLKSFLKPVIKISGPALGKGVFVCNDVEEASDVLRTLKENPIPGIEEGIMVEEQVQGKEVSMFFACNNLEFSYLGSAQDHKRLLDSDKGPNTGGMGAISPVPWVDEKLYATVLEKVLLPTLKGMSEEGHPFKGVLFLGLMIHENEMNLLEYNVRFGDPETQTILPLLDGDFSTFLLGMCEGRKAEINIKNQTAVHVVKAAKGYPGLFGTQIEKGREISLFPVKTSQTLIFFAGVKRKDNSLYTDGGRVLGVTSWGSSKHEARLSAYEALASARFDGEHYRRDIGKNV